MSSPHTPRSRISPWWWVVSIVGGLVCVIALVVWLGGSPAPDGGPWLAEPDKIVLAIIAGFIGLASPVVPLLLGIRKDTAATTEHVVNSHGGTIMRDDLDEIKEIVKSVRAEQREQRRDIQGLRAEIGQIRQAERDQWDAIERTGSRRQTKED